MPTERFLNLPEKKRQRIVDATMAELNRVPFDMLSINRIVQQADIARGSFYQYFADKEDLLGYVMTGFRQRMFERAQASLLRTGGDIFEMFADIHSFAIEYGSRSGFTDFGRHVFACLRPAGLEQFGVYHRDANEVIEALRPYADVSGLIGGGDALMLVLDTAVTLLREATSRAFYDMARSDEVHRAYRRQLEIIRRGALSVHGKGGEG